MLHIRNIEELKVEWVELLNQLNTMFDTDMDLQGVLFLIGVQELGHGPREFGKSEKQDLMHIATCKLLSQFGYYELEGSDDQGWPHWKLEKPLPAYSLESQENFLKEHVVLYFEKENIIPAAYEAV